MSIARKNIRIMFLLLAGLIIILQSTIPHHHHFSDFISTESSHESSDEANTHCHAFNNIVIEKSNSLNFKVKSSSNFILSFVSVYSNIQLDKNLDLSTFITYNIVLPQQYFLKELSLRGPPSLV